jgi:hypothetical protein
MMAEVVAISEHVDFTDILIEDGWAASVLSKTECREESRNGSTVGMGTTRQE